MSEERIMSPMEQRGDQKRDKDPSIAEGSQANERDENRRLLRHSFAQKTWHQSRIEGLVLGSSRRLSVRTRESRQLPDRGRARQRLGFPAPVQPSAPRARRRFPKAQQGHQPGRHDLDLVAEESIWS